MPNYVFECADCNKQFDVWRTVSKRNDDCVCAHCQSPNTSRVVAYGYRRLRKGHDETYSDRRDVDARGERLVKKMVLFAFGSVFPLVSAAVLAIIMPPLATWVVVGGIAIVTGVFSAWAGQELCQLLWNVRVGIDAGTQTMLKALEEASKEAKAARNEANAVLAERLESFFKEYGKRDEAWRTQTLAEWQAVTQALGSSFEKHLATLAEQERTLQEDAAQYRAKVIDAELARVKETFEQVEDTRNKLNAEVKKAIEALRNLVETEAQRQQQQKRADRDHHKKMLEVQQKAHDTAAERSGQLWGQLLDRLND